ncbi:eukaryotic translation elongation factor 2, partial [Flagelloscypha sp. PMI_526]
ALLLADGAVIMVPCDLPLESHVIKAISLAATQHVQCVVFIDGMERLLSQSKSTQEIYEVLKECVNTINDALNAFRDDAAISPEKGAVAFGSSRYGWAFTLPIFANLYADTFGSDIDTLAHMLWGDHFFDPETIQWNTSGIGKNGQKLERGFEKIILDLLLTLFDSKSPENVDKERLDTFLGNVVESPRFPEDFRSPDMVNDVLRQILPIPKVLSYLISSHLPSPQVSQRLRSLTLCGRQEDGRSIRAVQECNPAGPVIVQIYSSLSKVGMNDEKCTYHNARILSGTLRPHTPLQVMRCNARSGTLEGFELLTQGIDGFLLPSGEPAQESLAGSIVIIPGNFQGRTLASGEITCNLRTFYKPLCVYFIRVTLDVESVHEIRELEYQIRKLAQAFDVAAGIHDETNDYYIEAGSEEHIEVALKSLRRFVSGLVVSSPTISYRETVRSRSEHVALSKSQNKHNRLYACVEPLSPEFVAAIENGKVSSQDEYRARARLLADEYNWDITDARNIWCFGPRRTGPNVVVNMTRGVQYLNEIKDSVIAGFQWCTHEGVLCEEPVNGVRMDLMDVTMTSAIKRGGGQIIPTARRVFYAACLLASPALQEPICRAEILCHENNVHRIRALLQTKRNSEFIGEEHWSESQMTLVRFLVPMGESLGLQNELEESLGLYVWSHLAFDHWETMDGDPLEAGSEMETLVQSIRLRKGLKKEIPPLSTYYDKL